MIIKRSILPELDHVDETDIYLPDYEKYHYEDEWKNREIEDRAEKILLKRLMGKPGRCVELGGGFGRLTSILEQNCENTVMIDGSARNVRKASTFLHKTEIRRENIVETSLDPDSFDLVVMIRVVHHVECLEPLFKEIKRVVKASGVVLISVPNLRLTSFRDRKEYGELAKGDNGHRIFGGPIGVYSYPGFSYLGRFGLGLFDNRFGKLLHRISSLAWLDVFTSRFWFMKPMVFLLFRVDK